MRNREIDLLQSSSIILCRWPGFFSILNTAFISPSGDCNWFFKHLFIYSKQSCFHVYDRHENKVAWLNSGYSGSWLNLLFFMITRSEVFDSFWQIWELNWCAILIFIDLHFVFKIFFNTSKILAIRVNENLVKTQRHKNCKWF